MSGDWEKYLERVTGPDPSGSDVICLFLAHNEAHILNDLLAHYRAMGALHFLAIDDHSSDGTGDMLAAQPDVTTFRPRPGSTYAADKRAWRGTVLDAFGTGAWCLVVDADERLVWRGFPDRGLTTLIADMERQGADVLIATMIDMYADRPISEHVASDAPLATTFDRYDDPRKDPSAYQSFLTPSRFRSTFPLPNTMLTGGMRHRVFDERAGRLGALRRWMQVGALRRARHLGPTQVPFAKLVTILTANRSAHPPLNQTKVPLVKWQRGLRYNGGAHHLSRTLRPAAEYGVLLHYPITKGSEGIAYIAARGQHANRAASYAKMNEAVGLDSLNPVYSGTSRLTDLADLAPFFGRPTP